MGPVPAVIIVVPVMGSLIGYLGYYSVHFGSVVIMVLVRGLVTPPVGIRAMEACKISGITYGRSHGILPSLTLVWLAVIPLIAFVPGLVLWLPQLINNPR